MQSDNLNKIYCIVIIHYWPLNTNYSTLAEARVSVLFDDGKWYPGVIIGKEQKTKEISG